MWLSEYNLYNITFIFYVEKESGYIHFYSKEDFSSKKIITTALMMCSENHTNKSSPIDVKYVIICIFINCQIMLYFHL